MAPLLIMTCFQECFFKRLKPVMCERLCKLVGLEKTDQIGPDQGFQKSDRIKMYVYSAHISPIVFMPKFSAIRGQE
jgi:hypothetical protein